MLTLHTFRRVTTFALFNLFVVFVMSTPCVVSAHTDGAPHAHPHNAANDYNNPGSSSFSAPGGASLPIANDGYVRTDEDDSDQQNDGYARFEVLEINFTNPLGDIERVEDVFGTVYPFITGIVATLAVIAIVIAGILYITSGGREGQITAAKNALLAALIGLAIAIAAPSFLKEIYEVLGKSAPGEAGEALGLSAIALNVLDVLLSVVGVLAVIMLVIGGIMYITAAGNEDRIKVGTKIVTYAIIGLVLAIASLVIVNMIAGVV